MVLVAAFAGTFPASGQVNGPVNAEPNAAAEYKIHAGDQIDIKFFYHPELNEALTVRPDGRISLQVAGELVVDGVTARQLSQTLTAIYGEQLRMADATVIVRSFAAEKIYVDGEVGHPGVLALSSSMSLLQALAESGGIKETARVKNIVIIRRAADGRSRQVVRADALYATATQASDVPLQPYDIVYVSASRIANVNKWVDQYIRKNIPITFGILSNALLP